MRQKVLQSVTGVIKCDKKLLQNVTSVTKSDNYCTEKPKWYSRVWKLYNFNFQKIDEFYDAALAT